MLTVVGGDGITNCYSVPSEVRGRTSHVWYMELKVDDASGEWLLGRACKSLDGSRILSKL